MVEHFSFESSKKETLKNIRTILEGNGFIIKEYAPEDAFLFTEFKLFEWNTGRRLLAVTIHINDKITMTGMGKMDIPVSDLDEYQSKFFKFVMPQKNNKGVQDREYQ